jgi:hypothetical protein
MSCCTVCCGLIHIFTCRKGEELYGYNVALGKRNIRLLVLFIYFILVPSVFLSYPPPPRIISFPSPFPRQLDQRTAVLLK